MTRIAILGAAGRMGHAIARCLYHGAVEGLELAAAVDREGIDQLGRDMGEVVGLKSAGVAITSDLAAALEVSDVAIDFSFHEAAAEHAAGVVTAGKALVLGTTGLTEKEKAAVEEASHAIPVVMAPNMSLGVNLLFSLTQQAAAALKGQGYDVEIIERHHRRKKDAPSGTALGLGEAAAAGLGWHLGDVAVHGRKGVAGERPHEEIGFHAIRGGDVVGDHTVVFAADGEIVELSHRATSRDTFAVGALRAAAWVDGKAPGLYSMQDVLGLKKSS